MNQSGNIKGGKILRNSKSVSVLLTLITVSLLFSGIAFGDSDYYASVQKICNAYQITVDYGRMNLMVLEDGDKEFTLSVKSTRGQFDRVMLISFYAAGKAMNYHKEPIRKVTVVISVEYKGTQNIVASATREIIMKFVSGELTSTEFVRRVKFD